MNDQSWIVLITKLAHRDGLLVKIDGTTMTVADEQQMESQAPVWTFTFGQGIIDADLDVSSDDIYNSATVSQISNLSGTNVEGSFSPPSPPPTQNELKWREFLRTHPGDDLANDGTA